MYIDKVVVLTVAFEFDDKQQSWEKFCGSILRAFIHDAPIFVKYNDHGRTIEIKPHDKSDKGLHIVLIELHRNST